MPPPLSPEFLSLVRHTLEFLARQVPMGAWLFTHVDGEDWIVLDVVGDGYDLRAGQVLPWADSFCSRMVAGEGPQIAVDAQAVPAYAEQPAFDLAIGRYCGVPVVVEGLGLFGTLCGIAPEPGTAQMQAAGPWVINAAEMLSGALTLDTERERLANELDRAKQVDRTDAMTGLGNQRGFQHALAAQGLDGLVTVVVLDLDDVRGLNRREGADAGDRLIRHTARVLSASAAPALVYRVGGDRFAIVASASASADTDPEDLAHDVRSMLYAAGITASVGAASRQPGQPVDDVAAEAERSMVVDKRRQPA